MSNAVDVLSALADPTRLRALRLLWTGKECCSCEMMKTLGATASRMSRHMNALKSAGLVVDRRDAQWVRYKINPAMTKTTENLVKAALALEGKTQPLQQKAKSL